MTKTKVRAVRKPRILITSQDLELLESMVGPSTFRTAAIELLEEELSRAAVVNDDFSARSFCRIGSWVTYEDLGSGQIRNIQIVLPGEADIDKRRVSVLSAVGASLLGLAPDAEFGWTDDNGRPHRLKVLSVGVERHVELE
jgi:regulator of nucleoside diphosphate kinase